MRNDVIFGPHEDKTFLTISLSLKIEQCNKFDKAKLSVYRSIMKKTKKTMKDQFVIK